MRINRSQYKNEMKNPFCLPNYYGWFTLFLLIILQGSISSLLAQAPRMKRFTTEDGLPSSHIYWATQDNQGFIWLGTDKGIARFDGYDFEIFTVRDGLPSNDVWGIGEDAKGRLWFSTYDRLVYYENGKIQTLPIPEHYELSGLINHHFFEKGNIHFLDAEPGPLLYQILNNDSIKIVNPSKAENDIIVKSFQFVFLGKDEAGHRWFRAFGMSHVRLILYKETAAGLLPQQIIKGEKGESMVTGLPIIYFSDKLLMFSNRNMYEFNFKEIKKHNIQAFFGPGLKINRTSAAQGDKALLITSQGNKILTKDMEVSKEFEFLSDMNINTLFEDRGKNLWICTPNGLYFLSSNAQHSRSIQFQEYGSSSEVSTLALGTDNQLWVGIETGNLLELKPDNQIREIKTILSHQTKSSAILDMIPLENGDLVMCGNNGLLVASKKELKDGLIKRALMEGSMTLNGYLNYYPNSMKSMATNGDFLVVNGLRGLYEFYEDKLRFFDYYHNFRRRTNAIAIDDQKNIWIGRKSGLYLLSKDSLYNGDEDFLGFSKPINDIKIRNGSETWIATDGFGLYRWQNEKVEAIDETQNDIIKTLYIDDQNRIWLGTNNGVKCITIIQESPLLYETKIISLAKGLASKEVNRIIAKNDRVYIGTKEGLTILEESDLTVSPEVPVLILNNISVNGTTRTPKSLGGLKFSENNFNFEYVCVSYKSLGNIVYHYQLEGVDTFWHSTTALERSYPILPPGKYTFKLKAEDIDGLESEAIQIPFEIHPPWWKTGWARLSGVLLILLTTFLLMQWRIRSIKLKAEEQNKINKKFAELELQALQAQMNPHFVFNALQSIQDFIFKKNEVLASRYLVKFSRLMRLFLESSKEKYILLEEELQLLKHYVELEKMRFEDKFDYIFDIEENIEPTALEIPTMLLQPFVENAINHGLVHKPTKGLLQVFFKIKDDHLYCLIKDNGIGREKAMEIKRNSIKSYKSRGMELVKERQKILNYIEESNVNIQIIDLKDEDGISKGTEVEIQIPMGQ